MPFAAEQAVKYEYNIHGKNWTSKPVQVQIDWKPWNEGSMRVVYRMKDGSRHSGDQDSVAKFLKTPSAPKTYFDEVEMQSVCKDLAHSFNKRNPPKKIDFILPCVVEFPQRGLFATCEKMLTGSYKKHTNNYGFVSPEDRNTPQAFSHFSWVQSNGRLLVCDIQGVGDVYTDPQIHSNDGPNIFKYGPGDIGVDGINKFFTTHRCNAICEFLCLPTAFMKKEVQSGTALAISPSPSYDFQLDQHHEQQHSNNSTNRVKAITPKSGRRPSDFKCSAALESSGKSHRTSPLPFKSNLPEFEPFKTPRMMMAF
jgi:elongation factor 2 kinase